MSKNNNSTEFDFNSEFVFITNPIDDDDDDAYIPDRVDDGGDKMTVFTPMEDDGEFMPAESEIKSTPSPKSVKPKKEKKLKKELSTGAFILSITLKLLIICAVVAAMLALANAITAPIIAQNELEKKEAALTDIFPELSDYSALELEYENVSAVYGITSDGTFIGYAAEVAPKGFGGSVDLIIGIDADRNVKGIKVISHSETPSVGTKALADSHLAKYSSLGGKQLTLGSDIDAVSGATITSRAVNTGVNTCLSIFDGVIESVGNTDHTEEATEVIEPVKAVFTKERVLDGMYGWEDNGKGVIEIPYSADGTGFNELSFLAVSGGSMIGYLAEVRVSVGEFDYADLLIGTYYGRIQGVRFIDYEGAGFDKLANSLHEYIVPNYKFDIDKTEFVYGENVDIFEEADAEARVICEAAQKVLAYNDDFNAILAEVYVNE